MKTILLFFVAFLLFYSCADEQEEYVWQDDYFRSKIEDGKHELILTEPYVLYARSVIGLKLNTKNYHSKDNIAKYTVSFDSVAVSIAEKHLVSDFNLITNDSISIQIKDSLTEPVEITIEVFGNWYCSEKGDIKFTDGNPIFINTEKEEIKLSYVTKIPFTPTLSNVDPAYDYVLTSLISPSFKTSLIPEQEYLTSTTLFKYKPICIVNGASQEFVLENYAYNDSIVTMYSLDPLKSNIPYQCSLKAQWYSKIGDEEWKKYEGVSPLFTKEIKPYNKTEQNLFDETYLISYPLNRQRYFLIDEYDKGYIYPKNEKVKDVLLKLKLVANFEELSSGQLATAIMSYNSTLNIFEYDLPKSILKTQEIYKVSLYSYEIMDTIYSYYFSTSYYKTFKEKWVGEKLLESNTNLAYEIGFVKYIPNIEQVPVNEGIDSYESYSSIGSFARLPLIQFNSDTHPVFNGSVEEIMYSFDGYRSRILREKYDYNLSSPVFSMPPNNAIFFIHEFYDMGSYYLYEDEINGGTISDWVPECRWYYYVFTQAMNDLRCVSELINLNDDRYYFETKLFNGSKLGIPPMDITYVLPGINLPTTTFENYVIPE